MPDTRGVDGAGGEADAGEHADVAGPRCGGEEPAAARGGPLVRGTGMRIVAGESPMPCQSCGG